MKVWQFLAAIAALAVIHMVGYAEGYWRGESVGKAHAWDELVDIVRQDRSGQVT